MHFDARTQRALREAGLDTDAIAAASDRVAELVDEDADSLREFFAPAGHYYSDMEMAHSATERQEHATADVDLFTHGSDLRGATSRSRAGGCSDRGGACCGPRRQEEMTRKETTMRRPSSSNCRSARPSTTASGSRDPDEL